MKRSKDELLDIVRTHGGETPDDFTIAMLEDIADSFEADVVDNTEELEALKAANAEISAAKETLQAAYDALKKSYADRFTLKEEEKTEEDKTEEDDEVKPETEETFDSIFED